MTPHLSLSRFLFGAVVVLIAAFLLLPTIVIVPLSFTSGTTINFPPEGFSTRWYRAILEDEAWQSATLTSLEVALLTMVAAVCLGTAAALALDRGSIPGRSLVRGAVLTPLVTPVIVLAIGMFMTFVPLGLAGNYAGLVIAHTVLALPFVVITVTASLQTVNPNLELASLGLGAPPWRTFRRITLPLILPGVAAGAVFAFITSWDEIVAAIFLTTASLRTIPVLVWGQVRTELSPAIAAVGTILIMVSVTGLGLISLARRMTRQ